MAYSSVVGSALYDLSKYRVGLHHPIPSLVPACRVNLLGVVVGSELEVVLGFVGARAVTERGVVVIHGVVYVFWGSSSLTIKVWLYMERLRLIREVAGGS